MILPIFLACIAQVAPPETVTLTGKVEFLTKVLEAKGIKADPEPIAGQVALVTDEGRIVPMLSDEASRAFFKDERLRGRKAELTGLRRPDVPFFQVVNVKVDEEGAMRTPEYYCEVCAIHVRYPQTCPCCQGPMILQYRPEGQ